MSRPAPRVPLTPKEAWLSDGRQVLRFRPTRWERQVQRLEITTALTRTDVLTHLEPIEDPKAWDDQGFRWEEG